MSLVLGINLEDYAILATDKRGFVGYKDQNIEIPLFKLDNCQKLRQLPFGWFGAAGDYFVTESFALEANRKTNPPRNLQDILIDTHTRHCQMKGVRHFSQETSIILVARATKDGGDWHCDKDLLLEINIDAEKITLEEIEPMSLAVYMATMNPDNLFWDKAASKLRPIDDFTTEEDFFNYHLALVKNIWQAQLAFDDQISHHIDFYIHNRITGKGLYFGAEEVSHITSDKAQALAAMPLFALERVKE